MSKYIGRQALPGLKEKIDSKQDALVSGTNIKTINNQSILGEGNITIEGSGGSVDVQQFTNETAGIIKGSTAEGAITANSDGTGSVNGFSAVKESIADAKTMAEAASASATAAATAATQANDKANEAIAKADALSEPLTPSEEVANKAALDAVDTTGFTGGETYEVKNDETQGGKDTIYVWNAETSQWELKGDATPYATKEELAIYATKAELDATLGTVNTLLETI